MPTTTRSASRTPPFLSVARRPSIAITRVLQMENDAMLLVQRAHEVTHLRPEHAFHRPLLRRHHMNLDVAGAQRRRGLQSDEARADDERAARSLGRFDDGAAIGERAQAYGHEAGRRRGLRAAPVRRRLPAAAGHRPGYRRRRP